MKKIWLKRKDKESKPIVEKMDPNTTFQNLMNQFKASSDFVSYQDKGIPSYHFSYYKTMVDVEVLHRDVLPWIKGNDLHTLEKLKEKIPLEGVLLTNDCELIKNSVASGFIMVQEKIENATCLLLQVRHEETRPVSIPETEYSVAGPKEAFVESLDVNINLIRKRLPIPELMVKEIEIGKLSKTRVAVFYIEGITDDVNVQTVLQRLKAIEYDHIEDSSYMSQMISDNHHSPFPQLINTERPDRVTSVLAEGKVAIMSNGSPQALTGPTTLTEFFSALEDYYISWTLASVIRLIRLFSILFSVLSTPMYVAVLTYHYEMIPDDLLATLIASRSGIPFPPFLEAIILELTIELLREAGARLPTKVGQTIGIVGGIVIGTAAVQAGLTSNVLLILVALAALASFTTPVYQMSNAIRLIRFPFLIFAQILGIIGIVVCFTYVIAHLLKLTSLGRPYIAPVYPLRVKDFKDGFIRLPFSSQSLRPLLVRPKDARRNNPEKAKDKHDIDE